MNNQSIERILQEQNRPTIRPLDPDYKVLWDCYKLQRGNFWIPEEVDLSEDIKQWKSTKNPIFQI